MFFFLLLALITLFQLSVGYVLLLRDIRLLKHHGLVQCRIPLRRQVIVLIPGSPTLFFQRFSLLKAFFISRNGFVFIYWENFLDFFIIVISNVGSIFAFDI